MDTISHAVLTCLPQQQPYQRIRIALGRHHEPRQPKTLRLQAKTDEQVVSCLSLPLHIRSSRPALFHPALTSARRAPHAYQKKDEQIANRIFVQKPSQATHTVRKDRRLETRRGDRRDKDRERLNTGRTASDGTTSLSSFMPLRPCIARRQRAHTSIFVSLRPESLDVPAHTFFTFLMSQTSFFVS